MEMFLSIPRPKIQCAYNIFYFIIMIKTLNYVQFYTKCNALTNSLRFSDTLGHVLLIMHKINRDRAQGLTDTARSSGPDAGKELAGLWPWPVACALPL